VFDDIYIYIFEFIFNLRGILIFVFRAVYCNTIMQYQPTICTLFTLNYICPILDVFHMFRSSSVHYKSDSLKMLFLYDMFYMCWCEQSGGWNSVDCVIAITSY
jgi:hypothetical protein